ncbi:hypothetical protein Tco_0300365 [Tanacetum coccineum]
MQECSEPRMNEHKVKQLEYFLMMRSGDGGRRNEAFLHMLCILDGFMDVLFKSVKLVEFLLYLVSSHGWVRLSTQPTSREKVRALGASGVMIGSRVRVVWMEVSGGIVRARVVSRVVVMVVWTVLRGMKFKNLTPKNKGKPSVELVAVGSFGSNGTVLLQMESAAAERTRISVFIFRIRGIGVEMIAMVQGQHCVRKREVFRFDEFRIRKSEVFEKTSKQHSIWQGTIEGIFGESDSFYQEVGEVVWLTI